MKRAAVLLFAATALAAGTAATSSAPQLKSLRGVPLVGHTGLRLLVAADPPFVFDVDSGKVARVTGLGTGKIAFLYVSGVGRDAVVQLGRSVMQVRTEIYVVRHATTVAHRIGTGTEAVPAADGAGVWVTTRRSGHCALREIALDGRILHRSATIACSTVLVDTGSGAALQIGGSAVDPATGRLVARLPANGFPWARTRRFVLAATSAAGAPVMLTDRASGRAWRLPYPSRIGGQGGADQAAIHPSGRLVALSFSDPAYQMTGTQLTDTWLLDLASRRFTHLPDMPAVVAIKATSMAWTRDGRLVWLAETGPPSVAATLERTREVVAVWKPEQRRIAVRVVHIPERDGDSFVVW